MILVPVEVNSEVLNALLEFGLLGNTADAGNRAKVAEAIGLILSAFTKRTIND